MTRINWDDDGGRNRSANSSAAMSAKTVPSLTHDVSGWRSPAPKRSGICPTQIGAGFSARAHPGWDCSMAWQCAGCSRFWGYRHKRCPLCNIRMAMRMLLRRNVGDVAARMHILGFVGTAQTVLPLPKGLTMCTSINQRRGTPRCCRCSRCKAPVGGQEDLVLLNLARKAGRGRFYKRQ